MAEDPLDELPPEMAAAWRERVAAEHEPAPQHDPAPEPTPEPTPEPDPDPETQTQTAPPPRRSPLRAFAVLPLVLGFVLGARFLGIGGWRAGGSLVTAGLVVMALAVGLLLTRHQHLRVAYVGGALVIALVGSAWCVSTAPMSHGRLEEVLDRIPEGVLVTADTMRSGHGWCEPRCPTVTRTYILPARRPEGAMRNAVAVMQTADMIPKDGARVALSRALGYASSALPVSVDHQRFTTVVRVAVDPSPQAAGGSRVTLEITSRPGVREKPLTPVQAR